MKQGRRACEEQTLKDLQEVEGGWCLGGTRQTTDSRACDRWRGEKPHGRSPAHEPTGKPSAKLPDSASEVSERGPEPVRG
jgi:hypothetical protein